MLDKTDELEELYSQLDEARDSVNAEEYRKVVKKLTTKQKKGNK